MNQATDPTAGMTTPTAGMTTPTDQGATDPAALDQGGGDKMVLLTAKADGSYEVQPVGPDMQPVGDPIPAQSIDEAMTAAKDSLGAAPPQRQC